MNEIKKLTGLLFSVVLLTLGQGCDDRHDYYDKINMSPKIEIEGVHNKGDIWVDTIKLGFNKEYQYRIIDESPESVVLEHKYEGNGVDIEIYSSYFKVTGNSKGKHEIILNARDLYGHIFKRKFQIEIIENWLPVTIMEIKYIGNLSPNEIEVDASKSFDRDARFGGKIVMYEYELMDYILETPLPKIKYIFGTKGQKKISVRVKDNNGVWSDKVTKYFMLE